MRVHPVILNSSNARWHFPVAVVLLMLILISNLMKGADNTADASYAAGELRTVIVAKEAIEPGETFSKEKLAGEQRPVSTLPADFVTNWTELEGRIALGPIPAGYPLAKALVGDTPEEVAPVVEVNDPIEEKLAKVRAGTVELTLQFQTLAPERGSRVALSIHGELGKTVLVADDAWVEHKESKSLARVRVAPHTALFLEEARGMGRFSSLVIPDEGDSPFKGQAVKDIHQLAERLTPAAKKASRSKVVEQVKKKLDLGFDRRPDPGKFRSFAWITGEPTKFSLDKEGKIYVIDRSGIVEPLYDYNYVNPNLLKRKESSDNKRYQQSDEESNYMEMNQSGMFDEHPTGLEPLYPITKFMTAR